MIDKWDQRHIRAWRKRMRLSQSGAAARLCVPLSTYVRWENEARPIRPHIRLLCELVEEQQRRTA